MIDSDALRQELREGRVVVEFTKKDGTQRVMECTLNGTLIPTEQHPKKKPAQSNWDTMEVHPFEAIITDPNLFKVYDLDKHAWRSFRYESLTNVDTNPLESSMD